MKKKILFLSPLPPPYYGSAISSKTCLEILKNSKDFEVRNIKLTYSKELKDIGKINSNKIKGIFYVKKQIKKTIKEFKPDIIYFVPATSSYGLIRDFLFVREIKKSWNGKILFHIRSRILESDWNNKFKRKIIVKMFENQKAIVLGKELVEDLHGLILKGDIFILPNAIENEISDSELNRVIKKRRNKKILEILFLSNMDKTKGWFKLLKACKILNDKKINFKCNFVGAWPGKKEKKKFFNFVKKNNLNKKIFYLGKKVGKEKNQILKDSNILVFPTEYKLETFGRVILEGMMFGLPVIANRVATIPTTVQHNKTGFVLNRNTPEEIANYLEKLRDNKLRIKMGTAGRKRFLKEYEMKNYKKEFMRIFKKILST